MDHPRIINAVKNWVEQFVVQLNLCPFAKAEIKKQSVYYCVSNAQNEQQLLIDLQQQLEQLAQQPKRETTLLIHPFVLQEFDAYNQFLELCDALLEQLDYDGVFQIASFHPDYQFSDTKPNDSENYSNKSPFPLLHILREDSIEQAIKHYSNVDSIIQRNKQTLEQLGANSCAERLKNCLKT